MFRGDDHRRKDTNRGSRFAAVPRSRSLRHLAVGMLAAVVALAAAAPADANVRKLRHGVYAENPTTADLDRMEDAGVKTLRVPLRWNTIERRRNTTPACDPTIYRWDDFDRLAIESSQRGMRLLPVLGGSPGYASKTGSPSNAPPTGSGAFRDYECFVEAAVDRYGRGSTLGGLTNPIREWQAWNELNLKLYAARGNPNPREAGRFTKRTHRAITSQDSRAHVILAGMPELTGAGIDLRPFLNKLYRVKRVEQAFDAVAVHPYARNSLGVKGAMLRLRDQLDGLGQRRVPIWVTEIGWATAAENTTFNLRSERGQAQQLRKTFRYLENNRRSLKVGSIHWFRWRDQPQRTQQVQWQDNTGLYRRNGEDKQACNAFSKFTGGFCGRIDDSGLEPLRTQSLDATQAVPDAVQPSAPPE